jgi:hypothetical protein
MVNSELTLIGVLVDRSGSMWTIKGDMQDGLESFLDQQKEFPGETQVTLAQFDSAYEVVYPPTDIKKIAKYVLVPRNTTALLDAMGKFVTEVGQRLNGQKEHQRPGKVVLVIITDGFENASTEWKVEDVRKLVEQQQQLYNWEFIFLGSNIDAVTTAATYGIAADSSLTYAASAMGTQNMASSLSNYVTSTRSGLVSNFTEADRTAAMATDEEEDVD